MKTALAVAVGLVASVSMVPAADAKAPEACATLTQADVDAALGAGFTPLPQAKGGSDYSSCGYQKGRDAAAVTILGAPGGNGVEANTGREERQRAATRSRRCPAFATGPFWPTWGRPARS